MKSVFATLFLVTALSPFALAQSTKWEIKNSWSSTKEDLFADFIHTMGMSKCNTLKKCLTSSASNPAYFQKTPASNYYADCADLPFSLRAYFSWMEGLPFDYVNNVSPIGGGSDVRYSKDGNEPLGFKKIVAGKTYDGPQELRNISDSISTAMYRMHYKYVSDFYPAGINNVDIRPGTVLYDPSGHAAIIYDIDTHDGTIKMMDAHPDGSITRIRFDQKFVRSRVSHGAGFKNWRPELNYAATATLPHFSDEDRFQKNYVFNNTNLDYYDYVKTVMSGGNLAVNPISEVQAMIAELCANTTDRMIAVENGIKSGIHKQPHPASLPKNIYGTTGEWEEYSTPSRDARLKTGFVTLVTEIERFVQMYLEGSDRIEYSPKNNVKALAADLLKAYQAATQAPECKFKYVKSDGSEQQLSYDDVVDRLFKMSFDPYHCVELRWGATGSELATCKDDKNKLDWYKAEQGLRNQIERKYDDVMDFGVEKTSKSLGVSVAPDADLEGYLNSLL